MADYDFMQEYRGPHGPHLSYLTRYTLTRKEEHRLAGRSIRGDGKNTAGQSTGVRQQRALAAITFHLKRHPTDRQSESHAEKLRTALAQ